MWIYMRYWATGRHLYAIGGDPDAARLAGVKVARRRVAAYAMTGLLVGLAACCLIGSGGLQQNSGTGLELQVIAAVVIGGTSILGGRGTVLGTLLGAPAGRHRLQRDHLARLAQRPHRPVHRSFHPARRRG
ncbi:ABC transporter permease [Fodinicola feengrottensis]|uniref:ABC transporter permease n=1 Tax=Fodinicola feengrottensis TaxID=435914 RepID=UPI0024420A41|nr:hypothetical protein [Fodinicola feengrottensis]